MKNLLTLFLTALTALSFAQQPFSGANQPKMFKALPGTQTRPAFEHRGGSSNARSMDSCNTFDILDYSTYNELIANTMQISYNGSWNSSTPSVAGQEINSSFITINSADNQIYSYVVQAFDSLAFANFAQTTMYSKQRSASQITLDTVYMFAGVAADDTSVTGGLAGDSLVLSVYPITGTTINATPVQSVTYAGHDGLAPFVVGTTPGYMRLVTLPVSQTFNAGQGFAIGVKFFSSDTSSHFWLSYSYADSCGTVSYQGQTFTSPAYPSPFAKNTKWGANTGSAFFGQIDSTGPTTASVTAVSNEFGYFGLGFPTNCSYLYSQNWEILCAVNVNSTISLSIADSNYVIPCTGAGPYTIASTKGGDLAGATYAWSSNVYGGGNKANATIFNPGTYTVTVTNSQQCTATAMAIATSAAATQTPSFSFPAEICAGAPSTYTNTSSDVTGYSSIWYFSAGADSIQHVANPSHTYNNAGNYTISLIIDSAGCEFGTSQTVTVLDCTGFPTIGFENNVSIVPNPSNGNVNITISDADKNVTISVYNILGETVRAYATTESATVFNKNLDLSNMANGTYLVKIQSGSKVATKKLVITK